MIGRVPERIRPDRTGPEWIGPAWSAVCSVGSQIRVHVQTKPGREDFLSRFPLTKAGLHCCCLRAELHEAAAVCMVSVSPPASRFSPPVPAWHEDAAARGASLSSRLARFCSFAGSSRRLWMKMMPFHTSVGAGNLAALHTSACRVAEKR